MSRIKELDSLRGIAVLMVVFYHYTSRFSKKYSYSFVNDFINFEYGRLGVELFFMISGFVIYMSIKNINTPVEFLKKRFYRLYPLFWISLIFTSVVLFFFPLPDTKYSITIFFANLTMLPSLFDQVAIDGVYWTLKYEFFFYLFIFFLLIFKRFKNIIWISIAYLLIGLVLVIKFRFLFVSYFYGALFINGMLFYSIYENPILSKLKYIIIFLSCFLCFFLKDQVLFYFNFFLIYIFTLLINNKLFFLNISFFAFFGQISYALYLLHQNIGYAIQNQLINLGVANPVLLLISPFFLVIFISFVFTFLLEKKIIKIIKFIFND